MAMLREATLLLCVLVGNIALTFSQESSETGSYEVIVVGCGAAGLAATGRLVAAGVRTLCLEAESRVGGRISTQHYGSGVAEFGAEWIHGEINNVIIQLAKSNNITILTPAKMDYDFHLSNGSKPNKETCDELTTHMFSILDDVPIKPVQTIQTFLNNGLNKYIDKNPDMQRERKFWNSYLSWFGKSASAYNGVDNYDEISTKGLNDYRECVGPLDLSWGSKGYNTLFDFLLKKKDSNHTELQRDIELNKEVVQINWFPGKLVGQVSVRCADGSEYTAKTAIITVSIGVLQERSKSLFNPKLPSAKQLAIDLLELGSVAKMLLRYDQLWWGDCKYLAFVWQDEDITELSEEDKWLAKLFIATVSEGSHNVLSFWLTGEAARHVETISLDVLKQKLDWFITKFCQPHYPKLPTSSELRRSMWYNNPHFRGSYSYHGLRSDEVEDPTLGLRSPINHPRTDSPLLLFAGEASHEHYFSTVHGAIETGWREADRVIAWR